jgi:hypothetical protein
MTTPYQCPFCPSPFMDFATAKKHLEEKHSDVIIQIMSVIKEIFTEQHQAELSGVNQEELRLSQARAKLDDAEYMVVPFNKMNNDEFTMLLPGYPEVWADGDLESWVIRLPEDKRKVDLGIPTLKFRKV